MRKNKSVIMRVIFFGVFVMLVAGTGFCGDMPKPGATFPDFVYSIPPVEDDAKSLGLKSVGTYKWADMGADVVLVEVIGVYCAVCYKQAPSFNKLYKRIERKKDGKIKMFAIAAGGTGAEVKMLRKKGAYKYPIVSDRSYEIHKALGSPETPFTMLVTKDREVVFTHMGLIDDIDTLYEKMKKIAK